DTYVRKELADTLTPGGHVAFNIKLNKDYQPCAQEVVPVPENWEPTPGDVSMTKEDPTVPPAWEGLKRGRQECKPTGEIVTGTIKAYNEEKGWGFLTSDDLQARFRADVFVHKGSMTNCPSKAIGTMVTFELGLTE
ncbi:unnamed protein product, partial [Effrenium voratum]